MVLFKALARLREISPAIHYFTVTALEVAFFYSIYLLIKNRKIIWSKILSSLKVSCSEAKKNTLR